MRAPGRQPLLFAVLAFLLSHQGLPAQATSGLKRPLVEVNTTLGRMVVALSNETPLHRDNFLKLVDSHYYDSTLMHRVIPEFLVQGGDPESKRAEPGSGLGHGGPGYVLEAEPRTDLHHVRGALSAAPALEDSLDVYHTHGSQFFFVLGHRWESADLDRLTERAKERGEQLVFDEQTRSDYARSGGTPHLDGTCTVFGEVVEGLEVLDAIAVQPCDRQDRPLTEVRIWMRRSP